MARSCQPRARTMMATADQAVSCQPRDPLRMMPLDILSQAPIEHAENDRAFLLINHVHTRNEIIPEAAGRYVPGTITAPIGTPNDCAIVKDMQWRRDVDNF